MARRALKGSAAAAAACDRCSSSGREEDARARLLRRPSMVEVLRWMEQDLQRPQRLLMNGCDGKIGNV